MTGGSTLAGNYCNNYALCIDKDQSIARTYLVHMYEEMDGPLKVYNYHLVGKVPQTDSN
jgi:hypothetical protein